MMCIITYIIINIFWLLPLFVIISTISIVLIGIIFTLSFFYLVYSVCKGKGLFYYCCFIWGLFCLIPLGIKIAIFMRLFLFAFQIYEFPLEYSINSSGLPSHSDFSNILNPAPSEGSSNLPSNGGGGGGGNGSTITPETSSAQLEADRVILQGKLNQLNINLHGPNSRKTMNSNSLINLEFTARDREYMKFHLDKFHPRYSENMFGMVNGKGFSCKTRVTEEICRMFSNRNI